MASSYIPHEIKEFLAEIGLSEYDVNGIVSIIKKSFVYSSISYDIEVDDDERLLSVTVFDASYDDDDRDCHIASFYNAVNFDRRWHDFFSKSVVYFK